MGNIVACTSQYVRKYYEPKTVRLCSEVIDDYSSFEIDIRVHSKYEFSKDESNKMLSYLQTTKPTLSYIHSSGRMLKLIYQHEHSSANLRSNVVGDIISGLTSEFTIFLITVLGRRDVRLVEMSIEVNSHAMLLNRLLSGIAEDNYGGILYGIDDLCEQKIKEKFSQAVI